METLELKPPKSAGRQTELIPASIPRMSASQLDYNDFFWDYMNENLPLVLTNVAEDWECRLNWTFQLKANLVSTATNLQSKFSAINFDYLRTRLGNCRVPVADCGTVYFNSHAKSETSFYDFLNEWQAKGNGNNLLSTNNNNCSEPTERTTELLYLKDWHLKAQMPDYNFYKVPSHFASDWLNEQLLATGQDDYRFVYMGPQGTWTPFHSDVFGSYSWSTNIAGKKKWVLMPPGEELKLSDRLGNLPFCIEETLLQQKEVRFFTVLQAENEAIFVPSGWYHQVWNLADTISINHNWFNACNVQRIWCNLAANMQQVIAEIEDCRQMDNFDAHCQTMLRASFGINYLDFVNLLLFIAERRVGTFDNGNSEQTHAKCVFFDSFIPNDFHVRYDLQSIRTVALMMQQDAVICDSRNTLYRKCLRLLELTAGY